MVPVKFKDECPNSMFAEVVGHRGKCIHLKMQMEGIKKVLMEFVEM